MSDTTLNYRVQMQGRTAVLVCNDCESDAFVLAVGEGAPHLECAGCDRGVPAEQAVAEAKAAQRRLVPAQVAAKAKGGGR